MNKQNGPEPVDRAMILLGGLWALSIAADGALPLLRDWSALLLFPFAAWRFGSLLQRVPRRQALWAIFSWLALAATLCCLAEALSFFPFVAAGWYTGRRMLWRIVNTPAWGYGFLFLEGLLFAALTAVGGVLPASFYCGAAVCGSPAEQIWLRLFWYLLAFGAVGGILRLTAGTAPAAAHVSGFSAAAVWAAFVGAICPPLGSVLWLLIAGLTGWQMGRQRLHQSNGAPAHCKTMHRAAKTPAVVARASNR